MKKKIYKILVLWSMIIFSFGTSGCFNYRDINKIIFVTAMILDYDKSTDTVEVTTETFRPYRGAEAGGEKGQRVLFKGKGKTMFEAMRDINLSSSYKLHFSQCKAIIFTEKAARKGLTKFIDMIDRDQEILLRPYVFVVFGDYEKLFKLKLKEEEYVGFLLYNLIQNVGTSSRNLPVTVNEFLVWRTQPSMDRVNKTYLLTGLRAKEDQPEDKLEVDGCAVIQDDKMVDILPKRVLQGYNFIIGRVKTGTLEITNPFNQDQYVTLEILNSGTKTKIKYDKGKIILMKNVTVRASIGESQKSFVLSKESIDTLEQEAAKNIKRYSMQLFNEYKAKEIDIFQIEQELYAHYPSVRLKKPINETNLEMNVKVNIEGSSTKTNVP